MFFEQIHHGGGAGQYFRDLFGEQEGAWLDFAFLEQGAQEPGLHIDRCRLRHFLFWQPPVAGRKTTKLRGRVRVPRTCKFAAAPVS
jgi:hypothetical protein